MSITELVLKWAVQKGIGVLPRSTSKIHIEQNAKLITDNSKLSESDMNIIDLLDGSIDHNENCEKWAKFGECQNNPDYMLEHCAKSCRIVKDEL